MLGDLVLLLSIDRWSETASFETWFPSGTGDDEPEQAGLADVAFQVLRSHPEDPTLEALESLGARASAALDVDHTRISTLFSSEGDALRRIAQIDAARVARLRSADDFRAARRRARGLILRLRGRSVRAKLEESLLGNLFGGPTGSYGLPLLARQGSIPTLRLDAIEPELTKRYSPHNAVIVVCGDVDRLATLTAIRDAFGPLLRDAPIPAKEVNIDVKRRPPRANVSVEVKLPTDGDYLLIGWGLPPSSQASHEAFEAAAGYLATKHLTAAFTEDTRSLSVWTSRFRHAGAFEVMVSLEPTATATVTASKVHAAIGAGDIDGDVLEAVKVDLLARAHRSLDSPSRRAATLALAEIRGAGPDSVAARLRSLAALSTKMVSEAMSTYLANRKHVMVVGRGREEPTP